MQLESGRTELNFVDSYSYSLAAYDVAKTARARRHDAGDGAVSVRLDAGRALVVGRREDGRRRTGEEEIEAPDENAWGEQVYRMRVFSALIADTDRNAGNILIGPDWKLWMIDFTRAFRTWKNLEKPELLARCDKRLLGRLRILTADGSRADNNMLTTRGDQRAAGAPRRDRQAIRRAHRAERRRESLCTDRSVSCDYGLGSVAASRKSPAVRYSRLFNTHCRLDRQFPRSSRPPRSRSRPDPRRTPSWLRRSRRSRQPGAAGT